ncbi:ATP-dependent DNA helicase PIF1-like [Octopus bimaculoides]|uniref:ATP-dependent DNA helicase PIF1-like n=1 Tax=Octopus bimaculoides TaxID=37653 RepID=UPI00071C2FDA|nr:ATP-dependent DNA helicase PIF1-like [Octopus bimaculoides]|eukprot:XP_014784398.1 PREDICTED: ATP-dependent DNA helicase PIF1-like [Octopus bimaculoides]
MCELTQTTDLSIVCIMALNESVSEFNNLMLDKFGISAVEIAAVDSSMRQTKCQKKKAKSKKLITKAKKNKKTSNTAGLETVLKVGINARVIPKCNMDVDSGLCNGAMGTVKRLNYEFGKITSIDVLFDCLNKVFSIKTVKADYELSPGVFITRDQFPLCIAYAISIPKSQGISVDGVIVDLGIGVFSDGMTYVALSIARKLQCSLD